MPDFRPLRPGDPERLGGYRLIGLLGEGGQGIVYLGEPEEDPAGDADTDADEAAAAAADADADAGAGAAEPDGAARQVYAIKLLRAHLSGDQRARRYFAKELAAAQRVDQDYTARIIEADVDGETPYIVSEYVDGRPLSDAVQADGPMSGEQLRELAIGTLTALASIHAVNIVHRDFKPSNVLLGRDRPRVIDFGIARALDVTMSVTSGVVGTPVYMAPEQLSGRDITPATDMFAWGATMVFAATGTPPFGQDTIPAVMQRILNTDPAIGDLRSPLREHVWYCLAKYPGHRPTARQLLDRLTGPQGSWTSPAGAVSAPAVSAYQPPPMAPSMPPPLRAPNGPQHFPQLPPSLRQNVQLPPNQPPPPSQGPQPGPQQGPHQGPHQGPQGPYGSPTSPPVPANTVSRPPRVRSGGARQRWLPVAAAVAGVALVATVVVVAVRLARPDDPIGTKGGGSQVAADTALTKVVRASTVKGGTLKLLHSSDFDSLDPGDMYYTASWNFSRLYARSLMTYRSVPGTNALRPTADLATGQGEPSADLKTWTYRLRSGQKFEDGTPVTASDVRYAVARTFDPSVLPSGPSYFRELLDADGYEGPYKESDLERFKGVTAPDDRTVVFHLKKPYADFDHLATLPQTAPVPKAKDTGTRYKERPVSTGPYRVVSYLPGKSITLDRNGNWADDANRSQRPDRIEVTLGVAADALDQRLLSGEGDLDASGSGLSAATRARALADPELKRNTDNLTTGFLRYVALATKVPPFNNVHCRRAVHFAVERTATQSALGGAQVAEPATNLLPPGIVGRQRFDTYPAAVEKAKEELAACGKPNGFSTRIAIRSERPTETAVAQALTQSLARIGIKLETRSYPLTSFWSENAGKPDFVRKTGLGMVLSAWGPDHPTGLGFFSLLVDGRKILRSNNTNVSELDDPEINSTLDRMAETADQPGRESLTAELDRKVMDRAVLVPLAYDRRLFYRGGRLSNVYVNQAYGMYDFAALGVD